MNYLNYGFKEVNKLILEFLYSLKETLELSLVESSSGMNREKRCLINN